MLKNKLMQLFKDNARAAARFEVKAEADEATVYLYDAVGGWWGVEAADFVKELSAIEAGTIHLRINSPGGDVFDARAIATAIAQHPAKVVAHIDGLAASAATYIAIAADEVLMAQGAFFMVHNAWTIALGNAEELRETADLLDKVDGSIVNDYARKTGADSEQVKEWMAAETWFTADEAKEHGFVDSVFEPDEKAENCWNLTAYQNAPAALFEQKHSDQHEEPDRERFEARAKLFEITSA